jgi:NADH-quinone oxidoreductase subunit J
METAIFLLFGFLALASSVVVVAHKNPVYSTMGLVLTLSSVAVLFVLLGAPFLAVLQILIYAGAIVVLFLFVLMLLNITREEMPHSGQPVQRWTAILGAAIFFGLVGTLLWRVYRAASQGPLTEQLVSLKGLAGELFADYLLPFEMVGVLLLVAVIAATVLARRPEDAESAPVSKAAVSTELEKKP